MKTWWKKHGESVKKAAYFITGVIIGGCGLALLLN